jgi:hypothetical protein
VKRAGAWIAAVFLVLLALGTVSWTSATTVRFTDATAAPASEAYVRFHYYGYLINPVHPVTYIARGSAVVRADALGWVTIPGRLHVRRLLPLSMPPRLFIDHAYVPRLHNAFGPIAEGTMSRPGVFAIDEKRQHVTVVDVSEDPERWASSLECLFDCVRETVARGASRTAAPPADTRNAAHARELVAHLRREYDEFLEQHGQTARRLPPAPQWGSEQDRQLWKQQAEAQLAREPLWGPYMARMWRGNLAALAEFDRSLGQ